jgi:putative ABC transport system substrate-binding protein
MNTVPVCIFIFVQMFFLSWLSFASGSMKELSIAMVLWRGETRAEEGFKAGMKALGYSVHYTHLDAGQDVKKLGLLLHDISQTVEQYDYIYTFGTTVSRRAKVIINGRAPQIFNAVTDPVGAGIVESIESPGHFIGGASDAVPSSLQVKGILEVMKINRLGLFFNPREKNSMLIRSEFYQHARNNNFEIIDFRSPPVGNLLEQNLQRIIDNPTLVDAVFFPSDSFLASKADYIGSKLKEVRIASFCSLKDYIEGGLLMGFVVDYFRLGKDAASIIDKHQKGTKFPDIPIVLPSEYPLYINIATKEFLGLSLPESLIEKSVIYR